MSDDVREKLSIYEVAELEPIHAFNKGYKTSQAEAVELVRELLKWGKDINTNNYDNNWLEFDKAITKATAWLAEREK